MQHLKILTRGSLLGLGLTLGLISLLSVAGAANTPPLIAISSVPLILSQPTDPQIMLAITNSQSMDGDLSGAIMTGSGAVTAFNNSTSPVDYTVPTGFIAPITKTAAGGSTAYTVNQGGTLYDNSASRLNVAKQALQAVIQQYAASFDFGLMDYSTGTPSLYTTWVYYMSGPNGFAFGATGDLPPSGTHWVPNPCYNSTADYCNSIKTQLGSQTLQDPLLAIAASSDDPDINDVLYAPDSYQPAFLDYGKHTPSTPFPPDGTLAQYNAGSISVAYASCTPGSCIRQTNPTNAGYVPYSTQVLYFQRGFGYYTSTSATKGNLLVNIKPAGITGKPATPAQIATYVNQFAPPLAPETNNHKSTEIKALASQSPIGGILQGALNYFQKSNPPSSNNCPAKRYVVLVTDGLPTEDLSGSSWPPLGSISGNQYGVTATFNLKTGGTITNTDPGFAAAVAGGNTADLAATNDQALTDAIDQLQALATAGIKTYIVGMGAGVDPSKNPTAAATLKAMAIAGDTDNYFPGVTPQGIVDDLGIIFGQIQAANMSTTSVAVNSTSYRTGTVVYQAQFDTRTYGWTGNLVAYPLLSNGTVDANPAHLIWSARNQMQAAYSGTGWDTNRLLATFNPATGTGVPFRWAGLSSTQQSDLEANWNTLTASEQAGFGTQQAYGQAVLDYLRGDPTQTQANNGPFRNRTYLLGDIIDSAPLLVGPPSGNFTAATYATFSKTYINRTPVIYLGSNDGILHAFNATSGKELFAFLPLGPFPNLSDLSQPTYNANHKYFVDGSPNAGDVQFADDTWHTILTGGLNSGGKGIYAMDVTNPANWISESAVAADVLWDITSATPGFQHLGLTYSQPQVARLNINGTLTSVVLFGSGYNNDDGLPYLYIVNAETGVLIRSIDLCAQVSGACKNNLPNGLSTPLVLSSTGTEVADRVYVGDLQGNLWRIDLSGTNSSSWTATVFFKAETGGNTVQPITTQPVASLAPQGAGGGTLVYFGTGKYLGLPDISNTDTQSFYAVIDRGSTLGLPLARANLNRITLTDTTVTTSSGPVTVRTAAGSAINWSTQRGWYLNLPEIGERVITNPRLINNRVIFTTFAPNTASCGSGGTSWLMVINYATGGAFPGPELDIDNNGKLNSADQVNGQNPVGMSLGNGYAAAPTIMRYQQGPFNDIKLITTSTQAVRTIKEHGAGSKVVSWIQLR